MKVKRREGVCGVSVVATSLSEEGAEDVYISKIRSNVKVPLDVELGKLTCVVGENWSGKTALATAIELGLTGKASSVSNVPAELLTLAPKGQPLEVALALDNGWESIFRVRGNTSSGKKPEWNGKARGRILSHQLRDLLDAGPQKMRRALLSLVGGRKPLLPRLPKAFEQEWKQRWEFAAGESPAEKLISLSSTVDGELRTARAAIKNAQREPPPLPPLLEPLREKVQRLRVAPSPSSSNRALQIVNAGLALQDALGEADKGQCPCCNGVITSDGRAVARQRMELARQNISAREERRLPTEEQRKAEEELTVAERAHALYVAWEEARKAAYEAESQIKLLDALKAAANLLVKEVLEDGAAIFVSHACRVLPEGEGMYLQLSDGAREVCRLGLRNSSGVERPFEALSGVQRVLLVCALASAWATTSHGTGEDPVCSLVLIDEVALSERGWCALSKGLEQAILDDGAFNQAIICVPVLPSTVSSAWTVVRLG